MHYADIKRVDVANGPGVRVSLFVSGCNHHCQGCFNKEAWDFNYGKEFTEETVNEILEYLKPDYIEGITLLGGEPFEYENQKELLKLVRRIKKEYPNKSIWSFTGFKFDEDIINNMCHKYSETAELVSYIDVIVDGKFELENKKLGLKFKGSTNQRTIDVQESLKNKKVTLFEFND